MMARELLYPDMSLGTCLSHVNSSITAAVRVAKIKKKHVETSRILAKWLASERSNSYDNEVTIEIGFCSRAEARYLVESFKTPPTWPVPV